MPKYDPIMSVPMPKDYAEIDPDWAVKGRDDYLDPLLDDEPYDRCPFCNAAIAGVVGGVVLAVLMAAAFAIKEGMKWLM